MSVIVVVNCWYSIPSVLWCCWLVGKVAGMVICLERGADLHTSQLMPLPLTVSCFCKIQICLTFLVPAHPGTPGQRAIKRVCVCVLVQGWTESDHRPVRRGEDAVCDVVQLSPSALRQCDYAADVVWRSRATGCHTSIQQSRYLTRSLGVFIKNIDNLHSNQAQGLNLRHRRSLSCRGWDYILMRTLETVDQDCCNQVCLCGPNAVRIGPVYF